MPHTMLASISPVLSTARLQRYMVPGEPAELTLARYIWNVRLCEACYPTLHYLEITLRNRIHEVLTGIHGEDWYEIMDLGSRGSKGIADAKNELSRQRKTVTSNGVIAELTFGFWVNLFNNSYSDLWNTADRIRTIIPNAPARLRTSPALRAELDSIRKLRNRIFHHERIYDYPNLLRHSRNVTRVLGWIHHDAALIARASDRFPDVHVAGYAPYERAIKTAALTGSSLQLL